MKYGQVQYPNHRSYNFVWQADVIMKHCNTEYSRDAVSYLGGAQNGLGTAPKA